MKTKRMIVGLFVFVNFFVAGQSRSRHLHLLKDGVYEYMLDTRGDNDLIKDSLRSSDTAYIVIPADYRDTCRRLILKKYPSGIRSYYLIADSEGGPGFSGGTTGQYNLWLNKKRANLYKGKNSKIKLNVMMTDQDTIEVEVRKGMIRYYYSGGIYRSRIGKTPAETMRLTYVRELNDEDEKSLIMGAEDLKYKIEAAVRQAFLEVFDKHGEEGIYAFALSIYIDEDEIELCPSMNTLEDIDGLIDDYEDLHFKYGVSEWRYEKQGADSLFNEISGICSDEMYKRRGDEKAVLLFQKQLSRVCTDVLEQLKSTCFFTQITGNDIFLIHTISALDSDSGFNKRRMKKIVNKLNDNEYRKEYQTWMRAWNDRND